MDEVLGALLDALVAEASRADARPTFASFRSGWMRTDFQYVLLLRLDAESTVDYVEAVFRLLTGLRAACVSRPPSKT